MRKLILGIAVAVVLPSAAHAQAAPAPKQDCCDKMKAEGKSCCCDDMDKKAHADRDMSKMNHDAA